MIAALYVATGGCYFGLPDVDPWDIHRDARLYAGPWPVVAHPPCERWGRYFDGGPSWRARGLEPKKKGDDGRCFVAALEAVRLYGGVLEHPEGSSAWRYFGLNAPPRTGGWVAADFHGGWTCCVEQGNYGHRARKATWLYANKVELVPLRWGESSPDHGLGRCKAFMGCLRSATRIDSRAGNVPTCDRCFDWFTVEVLGEPKPARPANKTGVCQRLSHNQRIATPLPFRDLPLSIARTARVREAA